MDRKTFRQETLQFEEGVIAQEALRIRSDREANAEEFDRFRRFIPDHDGISMWPALYARHDAQVEPLTLLKWSAWGAGAFFVTMITRTFMESPTLLMQFVALAMFGAVNSVAEGAICAAQPIPRRLTTINQWIATSAAVAAVPFSLWLTMRIPGSPIAELALDWEGVTLVVCELAFLMAGATAGAGVRAFRWSRDFVARDLALRDQLIALGAEQVAPTLGGEVPQEG